MIWKMKHKSCSKCKVEKSVLDFYRSATCKDGISSWCKSCYSIRRKKYYHTHKERELALQKCWRENNPDYLQEWRTAHPEKIRQYTQTSLNRHPERHKEHLRKWRENNAEHIKKYQQAWLENNREYVRVRYNKYRKEKYKNDINFRLAYSIRTRLRLALKGCVKHKCSLEYLGCTIDHLKTHLESQFQPGMSWENYGKWHIDHIRPLSSFDLTDENQLSSACRFTNLQPLWKKDNLRKGSYWEPENDNGSESNI